MNPERLPDEQLHKLAEMLRLTRPNELTCDEWLDQVGKYAEAVARAQAAPPGSELVQHHLALCWECREEFDALLVALRADSEPPPDAEK